MKTDAQLLLCNCWYCKAEMDYRDGIRGSATPKVDHPGEQLELFPVETLTHPLLAARTEDPDTYEDIPARKYSG